MHSFYLKSVRRIVEVNEGVYQTTSTFYEYVLENEAVNAPYPPNNWCVSSIVLRRSDPVCFQFGVRYTFDISEPRG